MRNLKTRIIFLTGLTASLVLTGCGNASRTQQHSDNQKPSNETSVQSNDPNDPVLAHLNARRQVDPTEIEGPHSYTTVVMEEELSKDTNLRVVRLENQVADLHSDFKKLMPNISEESAEALKRRAQETLAQAEQQKQELMTQQAATLAEAERPQAEARPAVAPEIIAPASGNATSDVLDVRIGDHPDKTRIVLDVTAPAKFSYNIDSNQNLLIVQLPESSWSGVMQESLGGNAMVKGYSAQPGPHGGVDLIVELTQPGKLTMSSALGPNEIYANHRIVFDVAPF